jgi:hypothetical protein
MAGNIYYTVGEGAPPANPARWNGVEWVPQGALYTGTFSIGPSNQIWYVKSQWLSDDKTEASEVTQTEYSFNSS